MKSKKTKFITLLLGVLILTSMIPMTTMAAEPTGEFTLNYSKLIQITIDGKTEYVTQFELRDENGLTYYAYCVNMDITCNNGDKYRIVQDKDSYFKDDEIVKVKAALTYISNNYAWMDVDNYQLLIQTTLWRIIQGYEISVGNNNDAAIKEITDWIFDHIDELIADYNGVIIEYHGSGNEFDVVKSLNNLNSYGPFALSNNTLLKNVAFDLAFTQSIPGAEFTDADGNVISSAKPGEEFYVRAPYTKNGGDIKFTASAQAGTGVIGDFVLFCSVNDVDSEGRLIRSLTGQPLVGQPLVGQPVVGQPIISPETIPYFADYQFKIPCTPVKEPVYSQKYGSVTLTTDGYVAKFDPKNNKFDEKGSNVTIVPNSNHFTFAKLSKAELESGASIKLAMVVGNKIEQVGTASVKMLDDNTLEITFDGVYQSSFGAVAFTFMPTVKNGNIHSLGCFSHNNKNVVDIFNLKSFQSTDKKGVNYDKDWADMTKGAKEDGFIYLYVHFDSVVFELTE